MRTRDFRLASLQGADEFAFSSRFEKESNQPSDFWEKRVSSPFSRHFVAYRALQNLNPTSAATNDHPLLSAGSEWIGVVVLQGPQLVATASFSNETPWKATIERSKATSEVDNPDTATYHITGFYTAFEVRGQGLGKKLVENALHYILESRHKRRRCECAMHCGC